MNKIFIYFILIFISNSNIFAFDYIEDYVENYVEKNKLYESSIWKSLLHYRNNKPSINEKEFLLSYNNFSLKNELIATIKKIQSDKNYICKFPARYEWLKKDLVNLNINLPSYDSCEEFNIYLKKTNADSLDLVFASENVKNPSSMMGHVFFKINGNYQNKERMNSVSFFTVINHFNIPLLIYESTLSGMKGYFILSPYKNQISTYINKEERNIWEYKLKLTPEQQKLIYYHFWELKDIDMTYYFTGFNCATMIDDILSLTKDNYINENSLWITPKDVIKNAEKNDLIEKTNMIPSIEWKLNMLAENIDSTKINKILNILEKKNFKELKNFEENLEKEFILTYAQYLFLNENSINNEEYLYIINIVEHKENFLIDIKKYKNPLKTFDDSQISMSYLKNENENSLGLSFLGASNTIFDDNREYFSESSLKIGEINLLLDKDNIHINSINIYDMKSLIPWNNITKEFSKEFRFSYEKHYDNNLDEINVLNISGGVGLSQKIHNDVLVYNLAKIGTGINFEKAYPYTSVETGIIIYEILNMKTVLSHEFIYNQDNSNSMYQNLQLNQALFINKKIRTDINFDTKFNEDISNNSLMLKVNYFF